jgi:hypothetical protein
MAQRLERLMLEDTVESGRNARSLLDEAKKKLAESPEMNVPDEDALDRASGEVAEQLAWAEEALSKLQKRAEERARDALRSAGQREQELARRAGNLAGRGAHGDANLPAEMVDQLERAESAMREAARALEQGRGERGVDLQREAQRLLEQSDRGKLDQEDDRRSDERHGGDDVRGKHMRTDADVPRPDDRKAAEAFRKRVLEGLGQGKGERLSPAVHRYAEGLLQ